MGFVEGQRVTNREVMARWAYSEIVSPRVGKYYRNLLGDFCDIALSGAPFEALYPMHHDILVQAMHQLRGSLIDQLEKQHDSFAIELWTKARFRQALAHEFFNTPLRDRPMPFGDFLNWARDTTAEGTVDVHDPRVEAEKVAPGSLRISEAAIAIGELPNILVDGYLRSIVFLRDAPENARLPVWVGVPKAV